MFFILFFYFIFAEIRSSAEFLEPQPQSHFPETLPAYVQAILIYVPSGPSAVSAFAQSDTAGTLFRAVEFEILSFLHRFMVQLRESFFIIAGCHGIS